MAFFLTTPRLAGLRGGQRTSASGPMPGPGFRRKANAVFSDKKSLSSSSQRTKDFRLPRYHLCSARKLPCGTLAQDIGCGRLRLPLLAQHDRGNSGATRIRSLPADLPALAVCSL
ncbi:hypothetical protein VE23_09260 [Paenibacillus sp. D9]|nr:hypothetical protein VE23_09260 [Paenibacillus sp. D9]CDN46069.1 hypothetical protein BN871_KJ_00020 [Paenibacillus sp. P22]